MKFFIISDIHGSSYYLKKAMENFEKEKADYIIILGDILYHGARNDLSKGHNPKEVVEILNKYSKKIMAVRGNCDSEVDQMVLDFPITATYSNMIIDNKRYFVTHGHIYSEKNPVKMEEGSVFLYGHTHIIKGEKVHGINYINPGSVSIPKNNNKHSFGVLENNIFTVKDLDGNEIIKYTIK